MKPLRFILVAALLAGLAPTLAAQVTAGDPVVGNPRAKVHVVMYQDLECPTCALFHQALTASIMPAYASRVEFEFRDFPLSYHPWSYNAALIARYLDTREIARKDSRQLELGMDWRAFCFSHQDTIFAGTLLDQAAAFCRPDGITREDLISAFSRADLAAEIKHDQDLGVRDHLGWTPYLLVNGVALPRTASPQDLVAAINAALAQSRRN